MSRLERINERWAIRAGADGDLRRAARLGGFSLVTQRRTTDLAQRAETASRLAATLQSARHWVGEEKSIEREYRLDGSYLVRSEHAAAARRLIAALRRADRARPVAGHRPRGRAAARPAADATVPRAGACSPPSTPATSRRAALRARGHRPDLRRARGRHRPCRARRDRRRARARRRGAPPAGQHPRRDDLRLRHRHRPARRPDPPAPAAAAAAWRRRARPRSRAWPRSR